MQDDKVYTLVGMSETFEDYYYILQKEDGSRSYHSCVGSKNSSKYTGSRKGDSP